MSCSVGPIFEIQFNLHSTILKVALLRNLSEYPQNNESLIIYFSTVLFDNLDINIA